MPIGDVVEWRGKKYVQTLENAKDKASWKPVEEVGSVWEKPFEPSGRDPRELKVPGEIARGTLKTALMPFELLDQAAYNVGAYANDKWREVGASPEAAASAGVMGNLLTGAAPSILGGMVTEKLMSPLFKGLGRWSMQKSIGPDKASLMSGDAAKAIETMLKDGRNATTGGVRKMLDEVRGLAGQRDKIIDAASAAGKTVPQSSFLASFGQTRGGDFGKQVRKVKDTAAMDEVLADVLKDSRFAGRDIPIKTAQEAKTSTYRVLDTKSKNFGELTSAPTEAEKSIIHGLKEAIERAAPDVVPVNRRMEELLRAIEVIEPKALMAGNKMFGGLSYFAENPTAAAGFLLDRSPYVSSLLGRSLYNTPSILGVGAGGTMLNYMQ